MSRTLKPDGKNKLNAAIAALKKIAEMPSESDEWDGAEKYAQVQELARTCLSDLKVQFSTNE